MSIEIQNYAELFNQLLSKTKKHVEEAPREALNWKPAAEETNSVAAIAVHMCGVAQWWIVWGVAGHKIERDRPSEFRAVVDEEGYVDFWGRREKLTSLLRDTMADAGNAFDNLSEADLDGAIYAPDPDVEQNTRRYAILHTIDELAQHVGHLEMTLQMWGAQQA